MAVLPSLPRNGSGLVSLALGVLLVALCARGAWADEATVAVAANFAAPLQAIATVLQTTTGHTLRIVPGATGKLVAQIKNGAPFDVLLAADSQSASSLIREGLAVPGSQFTYATGQLVLWSAQAGRVDTQGAILRDARVGTVAYANPALAPYGAAAVQVMQAMGLTTTLAPKLVQGHSIGQAYSFVATGNADMGFVALSQVLESTTLSGTKLTETKRKPGSVWIIPQNLYSPITQDAVLLQQGAHNAAARALLRLLQSPEGQELIRSFGYRIDTTNRQSDAKPEPVLPRPDR